MCNCIHPIDHPEFNHAQRAEKNFDCILNELLLLIFGFEKYIRTPNMQSENSVNIFTQIPRHDGGQYACVEIAAVFMGYTISLFCPLS